MGRTYGDSGGYPSYPWEQGYLRPEKGDHREDLWDSERTPRVSLYAIHREGADGDESRSSRELEEAAAALRKESEAKRLNVLCVTIGDEAQLECSSLMRLAPDGRVQYLRDLKFREFFGWLSRSIQKTSQSLSGEEVSYEPTVTWGEIIERS